MKITRLGLAFIAAVTIAGAAALSYGAIDFAYLWAVPIVFALYPLGRALDVFLSLRWVGNAEVSLQADGIKHQGMLEAVAVDRNRPFVAFIERARKNLRYTNGGFALDTLLSPA
jgi:hypothetical protein